MTIMTEIIDVFRELIKEYPRAVWGLFGYYQALIRRTSHFVNNQQKSFKKNQFSSFGIVAGYYQVPSFPLLRGML